MSLFGRPSASAKTAKRLTNLLVYIYLAKLVRRLDDFLDRLDESGFCWAMMNRTTWWDFTLTDIKYK